MPTLKLTDPKIKSLNSNGTKRVEYYDELVGGLALRVSKSGSKSFVYRYRFGGHSKRFTIGKYPTIKLSDARKLAREAAIQLSTGIDPGEEKKKNKRKAKPVTVADLADSFIKNYVSTKKPSTQSSYKSRINSKIVPHLGSIPVKDLSKSDVKKLLEKIALRDGKGTSSNRVHAILSKMLGYATEKDWIEVNFMSSIKKVAKEVPRDRFYSDEEIKRLWEAFEKQEEPMQSLLKMLLICGQRLGETSKMKWSDISKENIWTIHAEETKAGRKHTVPLPGLATEILKKLRETNSSEYVFESTKKKWPNPLNTGQCFC